jgi:Zn-dependent metalloprotease/subtilisin-like proprotein convertase family protein
MKKLILGCILVIGMNPSWAQVLNGTRAKAVHPSASEARFDYRSQAPLYVEFESSSFVSASAQTEVLNSVLKVNANDSWTLIRSDRDDLGMTHHRYQQYFQQVKVMTGEYILHEKQGRLVSMNGMFFQSLNLNTTPSLDEKQALQFALNNIGASKYLWQSSTMEQEILSGHNHGDAYPHGELVILPAQEFGKSHATSLCWKFDIYAMEPHERWAIYVDAKTGAILFKENKICTINVNGTASTMYSGTQIMQVDSLSANSFRLRDASRGSGVETYDMNNGTSYAGAVDFTDTDNIWNTTTNMDNAAYDAHWGTQKTYDYYLNTHSRNSYDNAGAVLRSYIHYSTAYNNAFWNGSVMTYGDGDGSVFSPLTELDIIGHELTHGVTSASSNLVYSYQSGALNESFSDIFGVSIDFYANGASANFLIGDKTYTPGTPGDALRYMNNPSIAGDPDTYLGPNWYTGAGDNGGVHINSGVQNFWYYLLCQGGSGTNDLGFVYSVAAITMNKARLIAYRNNTFYLTSGSQYADAAFYSLKSANDLYGVCSPEAVSVKNAWDAVGVYGLTLNAAATAAITGSTCQGNTIQLNATGGVTFSWSGPGGFSSSIANPTIPNGSAANNGVYTCIVTDANGCVGNPSVNVNVLPPPNVNVTGAGSICSGGSLQLNANASVSGAGTNIGNNSTPFNIPDNNATGIQSLITVGGSTNANALIAVTVDSLTHTWDADLKLELIAPSGNVITLAQGVGGSGDNFIRTRFMNTGTAIASGVAPFTGNYIPQQAFSGLTGSADGIWRLKVSDLAGLDVGTLWKWSIELPGNIIVSYNWTPSTGLNNATITNPLASPAITTNYTVTVTSSNGCTASGSALVTIGTLSTTVNSTNVTCFGNTNGTASMQVNGGTGNITYNWSNGATSASITGLAAGTYTCSVTDGSGCTAVKSITITSPAQLEGFATSQNANCGLNDGAAYLGINGGVTPYAILWSNGATTANISGLAPGNYTVLVTDVNGCTFSTSATVGSNGTGAPTTPTAVNGNKTKVCPGLTKNYDCPAVVGATSYIWTVPANATITNGQGTTNITVDFLAGFTSGNISVQAQNSCGSSLVKTVVVRSIPGKPKAITGDTKNLCGLVSTYSIPASTTGGTAHNWTVPASATILSGQGTTSIDVQWPSVSLSGASVCVTSDNVCGSSPLRCLDNLTTKPSRPAVINGPSSVCANQTNISYSIAAEPGVTYTWKVPSGASLVSGQGTGQAVINWGSTTGLLEVKPSNNCGVTQSRTMTVTVTCRLSDDLSNSVQLVPNPSKGQSVLNLGADPGTYQVTISDVLGRTILTKQAVNEQFPIDLKNQNAGLYLVAIRFEDGRQKVLRMIIE